MGFSDPAAHCSHSHLEAAASYAYQVPGGLHQLVAGEGEGRVAQVCVQHLLQDGPAGRGTKEEVSLLLAPLPGPPIPPACSALLGTSWEGLGLQGAGGTWPVPMGAINKVGIKTP